MIIVKKSVTQITYGFHKTHFGLCLIGTTDDGICHLSFPKNNLLDSLKYQWPSAELIQNELQTQALINQTFNKKQQPNLVLKGTKFQVKVWKQLLKIPYGTTTNYQTVATQIGHHKAHRAVASAIANNSIAYIIPCHRVIRKSGALSNYRWGIELKQTLLNSEQNA